MAAADALPHYEAEGKKRQGKRKDIRPSLDGSSGKATPGTTLRGTSGMWGIKWGMWSKRKGVSGKKLKTPCFPWRSQRGSNPRFRRERAVSWATRRWDHLAEEPGFEPGKPGPEPGVMPFHHSSTENAGYPSRSGPVKRESRREPATLQRCFSNLVFRPSGVYHGIEHA